MCRGSQGPVGWRASLAGYPSAVEIIFTTLLVLAAVATVWFSGYVVYRLYSDQR
ncbi:hypothetical protein SacxiDRAFT_2285 [Saccharomonospora xinjiangensis XJ-54]|uniref:Uncharacterized protein n=1 Tax=Saccharomonospora xinjiangensis XJ-54 TaxID=882086 RepID=I0V312_9PSEU|nr:hypothetical protein SacxiDRAFT_2285 [Saccharomonospora xinjiangensis XJ-54]